MSVQARLDAGGVATFVRDRVQGTYEVDDHGLDAEVHALAVGAGRLVWPSRVSGVEHVPVDGPALLVVRRGPWACEPAVVGVALAATAGRPLRWVGVPDRPAIGAVGRSLGGLVDHPAEIAAALRGGALVGVGLGRRWWPAGGAGPLETTRVAPALEVGVPVVPVRIRPGLRWRVEVRPPLTPPAAPDRAAVVDFAGQVRTALTD